MSDGSVKSGKGRKKKAPILAKDLQGFNYLRKFIPLLERFHLIKDHHNRDLHFDHYISLILFYFYNPILTSLRGIQQATQLERVQDSLGINRTSLGSLSEAAHVFDANLLSPLIQELAQQAMPVETDPHLKRLEQTLSAVDGTLLPALPKMLWALWLDDQHRAAKLHLELDVLKNIPMNVSITDANASEKMQFRRFLAPDKLYVFDAGYSEYRLFQEIIQAHSSFVGRLRDNAVWDTIEDRPLTDNDRRAGVRRDIVVHLGCKDKQEDISSPVRVVEVFHQAENSRPRASRVSSKKTFRTTNIDYSLLLVTDRMDLPAEIIALIYRYRWQVELFFRWFKCILGCTHLLSLSKNGVSLQVYSALIASMLITLWTGCKPNKRTFEMLSFYFMGWANDEELAHHIEKLKEAQEKKKKG